MAIHRRIQKKAREILARFFYCRFKPLSAQVLSGLSLGVQTVASSSHFRPEPQPVLFLDFELVFAHAAERANPIVGQGFERRAWRDARIGIAGGGVIDVTAYGANILFHSFQI